MKNNQLKTKWYAPVPNIITLCNLACGVVGTYFAFEGNIQMALILMISGAVFDFFDGFFARLLKVSGDLGKQLDSLSDLISFGLLPGVMVFAVQKSLIMGDTISFELLNIGQWITMTIPIFIPIMSAYRLAKFNIDTRQTSSFIGLPTPANALFFASLMWVFSYSDRLQFIESPLIISILTAIFSILLITEIPLFALKFANFKWKDNEIRFIFLALSLVLLISFNIAGLPLIILLYIALSIGDNFIKK